MSFIALLLKLKSRIVNQKEQDYSMESEKYYKHRKEQKEHMGHGEKSNIYIIWVSEREERENGVKVLFGAIIFQKWPITYRFKKYIDFLAGLKKQRKQVGIHYQNAKTKGKENLESRQKERQTDWISQWE